MDKIKQLFKQTNLDCILIRKNPLDVNFSYFTKLPLDYFDNALLVLKRNEKPIIFVSSLEYKWLAGRKDFDVREVKKREEFRKELKKEISCKKIGLDKSELNYSTAGQFERLFKNKSIVNVSKEIEKLREIKGTDEIECIRKAGNMTSKAFTLIPELVKDRLTEKQCVLELEYFMKKQGSETLAFPPIVASGKNAGIPHFIPSDKKIQNGFLMVDIGARYKNYCSDMSRTFFVGKPTNLDKKGYALVREAKNSAESLLKEGISAKRIHNQAEKILKKGNYPLVHALGHGLGLKAHDVPARLNSKVRFKLKENMVFTIEPGIYDSQKGIRIEDVVLIKKKGFDYLGNFTRELIEI